MRNLGNTCFASAAVCALRSCPRARAAVAASRRDPRLARMLADVMDDPASPAWPALVRATDALIGRRGREPHDSHELLCALVDRLGLDPCFAVNSVSGIKCGACGKEETRKEINIYVAAEPAASLGAGLAASHSPRWVEGRECDEGCGRRCRAVMRSVPRAPAPPVLVVRVSRGGPELWVEHALRYCGATYGLRAVIMYRGGGGGGGHYVCGVLEGGRWRVHDDDEVGGADVATVSGASLLRDPHTVMYQR